MKKVILLIVLMGSVMITFYTTKNYYSNKHLTLFHKLNTKATQKEKLNEGELRHLKYLKSALDSLHLLKGNPISGEWLAEHKEKGQTYLEYKNINPIGKTEQRFKLYIQPIGFFSNEEKSIMVLTSDYLSRFYNMPVEILDSISTNVIPLNKQRQHDGMHQINAKFVLDSVLEPIIPNDAAAYIAFSNKDLYPSEDRNFVFGLGSIKKRVGVYSSYRYGNPSASRKEYQKCLYRTLKVASHELGHMFSIKHCTEYECLMNGSNSLEESDLKPIYMCPVDLMKVGDISDLDEIYRFQKLQEFWGNIGFNKEAEYYKKAINSLKINSYRR